MYSDAVKSMSVVDHLDLHEQAAQEVGKDDESKNLIREEERGVYNQPFNKP